MSNPPDPKNAFELSMQIRAARLHHRGGPIQELRLSLIERTLLANLAMVGAKLALAAGLEAAGDHENGKRYQLEAGAAGLALIERLEANRPNKAERGQQLGLNALALLLENDQLAEVLTPEAMNWTPADGSAA